MATTCKLIAKNVLGSNAASVTFSSIPSTYTDLVFIWSARSTASATRVNSVFRLNGNAAANYSARALYAANESLVGSSSASSQTSIDSCDVTGATATANTFANGEMYLPNYAGSTNKSMSITTVTADNSTTGAIIRVAAALWSNTAAITSLSFAATDGNLVSGSSFFLYGITKA